MKYIFSFYIKIFLFYLIIFFNAHAEDLTAQKNLIVLGKKDAPVKIKIFSSLTCPHCANFHIEVVPKIEKNMLSPARYN